MHIYIVFFDADHIWLGRKWMHFGTVVVYELQPFNVSAKAKVRLYDGVKYKSTCVTRSFGA